MKRITRSIAEEVANKMCNATIDKEIDTFRKELNRIGTMLLIDSLPKQIVEAYKHSPSYFKTSESLYVFADDLKRLELATKKLPVAGGAWANTVEINRNVYDSLLSDLRKLRDLKDRRNQLYNQIYSTLLSLSTPKKIKEQFPEGYAHIAERAEAKDKQLALPIEDLRKTLSQYN